MKACVCDIGGTYFRIATYHNGKIEEIEKIKTPNFYDYSESEIKHKIVSYISESINRRRFNDPTINKLAVCFPGPVNANGEALGSSVIFGSALSENYKLKEDLIKKLPGIEIKVMNDLTAAAYRYMGNGNFCLITISSGIGNKISINDQVIIGPDGKAGEIGHFGIPDMDIDIDCTCGTGKNHVGMISSGRGVELIGRMFASPEGRYRNDYLRSNLYYSTGGDVNKLTAEVLAEAADEKDVFARKIVDYCTLPLSYEICLLATALYIPHFIIIGGFALHCQYYLYSLKESVKKRGIYNFADSEIERMIVYGEKDDNHGLIGAGIMICGDYPRHVT